MAQRDCGEEDEGGVRWREAYPSVSYLTQSVRPGIDDGRQVPRLERCEFA